MLLSKNVYKMGEVKSFVEMYHPDNAVMRHVSNLFNGNATSPFRNILKQRQKQV